MKCPTFIVKKKKYMKNNIINIISSGGLWMQYTHMKKNNDYNNLSFCRFLVGNKIKKL